jgi:hypothetical protein
MPVPTQSFAKPLLVSCYNCLLRNDGFSGPMARVCELKTKNSAKIGDKVARKVIRCKTFVHAPIVSEQSALCFRFLLTTKKMFHKVQSLSFFPVPF